MGNTQEGQSFEDWLRVAIASKRWSIADLSREIARREGKDERDLEDFNRRAKAIHGHVSNMLNGQSNWGDEYLKKIASALGIKQSTMLEAAGKLQDDLAEGNSGVDTVTRGKLEALLEMLDEDERVQAIQYLALYVQSKQQTKHQQKAHRAKAKPKRT